jgi:hypothetical protein
LRLQGNGKIHRRYFLCKAADVFFCLYLQTVRLFPGRPARRILAETSAGMPNPIIPSFAFAV